MNKKLAFFGAIILGSVITAVIDSVIGVSFAQVGPVVAITHKVTYMLWGGGIAGLVGWLKV